MSFCSLWPLLKVVFCVPLLSQEKWNIKAVKTDFFRFLFLILKINQMLLFLFRARHPALRDLFCCFSNKPKQKSCIFSPEDSGLHTQPVWMHTLLHRRRDATHTDQVYIRGESKLNCCSNEKNFILSFFFNFHLIFPFKYDLLTV